MTRQITSALYPSLKGLVRSTPLTEADLANASYRVAERLRGRTDLIYVCTVGWGSQGEFDCFSPFLQEVFGDKYSKERSVGNIEQADRKTRGYRPIPSRVVDRKIVNRSLVEKGEVIEPGEEFMLPDHGEPFTLLLFDDWCVGGSSLFGYLKWALENKENIGYSQLAIMVVNDTVGAANYAIIGSDDETESDLRRPKEAICEWLRREEIDLPNLGSLSDDRLFGVEHPPSFVEWIAKSGFKVDEVLLRKSYKSKYGAHMLRYYYAESDANEIAVVLLDQRARDFVYHIKRNLGKEPKQVFSWRFGERLPLHNSSFPIFVDFEINPYTMSLYEQLDVRFNQYRGAYINLDGKELNPTPFVLPIGSHIPYDPEDPTVNMESFEKDFLFTEKDGMVVRDILPENFVFRFDEKMLSPEQRFLEIKYWAQEKPDFASDLLDADYTLSGEHREELKNYISEMKKKHKRS